VVEDELSVADDPQAGPPEPWSQNLHYHRVILDAVPPGCERALDVGCGQGTLTRRLRRVVPQVTGIDRDQRSIDLARANPAAAGIAYILGDFLAAPFRPGSLDLVTSVASLHHMDAEAALPTPTSSPCAPSLIATT
jgi:2-polyprenyl-3-methyl-5-hydroxy-6-metoxy-1,4-benzoquinol methylase